METNELEELIKKVYEPYYQVVMYIKDALKVLRHHDYLLVNYNGEETITVTSSNKKIAKYEQQNIDSYLANEVYFNCIRLGFTKVYFKINPNAYEMKYYRK